MKKTTILLVLIAIIVIGVLGFFAGRKIGEEKAEQRLGAIINMAYPAPPQNLHSAGGEIVDVYGNKITFKMTDPEDYLPHPDGSPHKKIERVATVGSKTEIVKIDYTNYQPDGSPETTSLSVSDLRKGDRITVRTDDNLRTDKTVAATKIEIIKY